MHKVAVLANSVGNNDVEITQQPFGSLEVCEYVCARKLDFPLGHKKKLIVDTTTCGKDEGAKHKTIRTGTNISVGGNVSVWQAGRELEHVQTHDSEWRVQSSWALSGRITERSELQLERGIKALLIVKRNGRWKKKADDVVRA